MKFALLTLLVLPLVTHASLLNHDHRHLARRDHFQLARTNSNHLNKRCGTSRNGNNNNNNNVNALNSSSSSSARPGSTSTSGGEVVSKTKGLISVKSDCGDIGATKDVTATTGPNGSEDWLNCGINDEGWRPPNVKVDDLITEDLSEAIKSSESPFQACGPYVDLFDKYAQENGIPSILLAAFALQESSCKPDTTGGAGEQGIMQITKDKCGGAPGGNCKDPDYNIRTGAKFFADTLASNDGNVIKTIGMYNGWKPGMTFDEAIAAGSGPCCHCQNNLDYIHQFANGWLQNKDVYGGTPRLGTYFNLDKCGP